MILPDISPPILPVRSLSRTPWKSPSTVPSRYPSSVVRTSPPIVPCRFPCTSRVSRSPSTVLFMSPYTGPRMSPCTHSVSVPRMGRTISPSPKFRRERVYSASPCRFSSRRCRSASRDLRSCSRRLRSASRRLRSFTRRENQACRSAASCIRVTRWSLIRVQLLGALPRLSPLPFRPRFADAFLPEADCACLIPSRNFSRTLTPCTPRLSRMLCTMPIASSASCMAPVNASHCMAFMPEVPSSSSSSSRYSSAALAKSSALAAYSSASSAAHRASAAAHRASSAAFCMAAICSRIS